MPTGRPSFALLSLAANLERHKIASGEPFLVLLCLTYPGPLNPTAPQEYLRLVRNTDPVTFDADDGLGPQVYQPFNFELGDMLQSTTGSVPEMELKISNVMRSIQTLIEGYGGLAGASLNLYFVNAASPAASRTLRWPSSLRPPRPT